MSDFITGSILVNNMSSKIIVLFWNFFTYFGQEIVDGIEKYGSFCRRHNVKAPAIMKSEEKDQLENMNMQPLPVQKLFASFEALKQNPNVNIHYK